MMIDRVELQRILGYIVEIDEKRKSIPQEKKDQEKEVRIEVAKELKDSKKVDYEELYKKVEDIKEKLKKGTYEVSSEKILKGLEETILIKL